MKLHYFLTLCILLLFTACNNKSDFKAVTQDDITKLFSIELLKDETYYFEANKFQQESKNYQALKKFDLIFTAYDVNASRTSQNSIMMSNGIPGDYTHVLMYLGKDSQGFAYGIEMNSNMNKNVHIGVNGLETNGQLYVYCLGSDFNLKSCPNDNYIYGLERYDYMWAKRLNKKTYKELMKYEGKLIQTIKKDLKEGYPFQLQFAIKNDILSTKEINIIDDGHKNGADCTSYFISLFEEVAHICLDNVRMKAKTLENYFINNPKGQQAHIPLKYNIIIEEDVYFTNILDKGQYSFIDNKPRQTLCSDRRKVSGFSLPSLLFDSPSMIDVPLYKR